MFCVPRVVSFVLDLALELALTVAFGRPDRDATYGLDGYVSTTAPPTPPPCD